MKPLSLIALLACCFSCRAPEEKTGADFGSLPVPTKQYVEEEVDSVVLGHLTDRLIAGDPQEAREALAELRENKRLLVESVFVLLPQLDACGEDIEWDYLTKLQWSPPPFTSYKSGPGLAPRKRLLLAVLARGVCRARPGPRRNEAQRQLLAYIEWEYA